MILIPREIKDKKAQIGYPTTLPHLRSNLVPQISPNTILGHPELPESGKKALTGQRKLYKWWGGLKGCTHLPPPVLLEQRREQKGSYSTLSLLSFISSPVEGFIPPLVTERVCHTVFVPSREEPI